MIKCSQCGDTIPSGIKFCPSCGTPAPAGDDANMGNPNPEGEGNLDGTAYDASLSSKEPASESILTKPIELPSSACAWIISTTPLIIVAFIILAGRMDELLSDLLGTILGPALYGVMLADYFLLKKKNIILPKAYIGLIVLLGVIIGPFYLYSRGKATGSQKHLIVWCVSFIPFMLFAGLIILYMITH